MQLEEKICVPLKMQVIISYFVFRRQPAEFFLSKKCHQMNASQHKIQFNSLIGPAWLFKLDPAKNCLSYASLLNEMKVIISILLSVNISTIFRISDLVIISKAFFLVKIAATNCFNFERIATFLCNM